MNDRATQPIGMPLIRRIGGSELRVFPVALSSAGFADGRVDDPMRVMDEFQRHGGDLIASRSDGAGGAEETQVGRWLAAHRNRERFVLASDVMLRDADPRATRDAIVRSVDASLERLGTDMIDLLVFRVETGELPIESVLVAAHDLIADGRVRYIGAQRMSPEQVLGARIAAAQGGLPSLTATCAEYSLLHREIEDVSPTLVQQLGLGILPSNAIDDALADDSELVRQGRHRGVRSVFTPRGARLIRQVRDVLDRVADEHDVTWRVIALAWVLSRPGVAAISAQVANVDEVARFMDAPSVLLTREQLDELDRVSARAQRAH